MQLIVQLNNELIGCHNKSLINKNLFDFIKIRVNMRMCERGKFVINHFKWLFLINLL